MKPEIKIFDVATQQETIREMNDEEYAQHLLDKEIAEKQLAEQLAKEQAEKAERDAAKAAVEAKLAALGLDLDTVKLLGKLG